MMVNPISNQPGVIDSSTAEKRKQRDRRDLPKKASHQAGEKSPAQGRVENPCHSSTIEEDSEAIIDLRRESPKEDEEQTPRIDITV